MYTKQALVIGALFDFAGYLTTRPNTIPVGATADASPMAQLVSDFMALRHLDKGYALGSAIENWSSEVNTKEADAQTPLLQGAIDSVTAWHKATGLPAPDKITFNKLAWDHPTRVLRRKLLKEEYEEEYQDRGEDEGDLVELADALADMIYIIIGTAVSYGIPLEPVMRAVCVTNDAKLVFNEQGEVRRREDGKILKPDGWEPPDIKAILDNHGYEED